MTDTDNAKSTQPPKVSDFMPAFDPLTQAAPYIQDGFDRLQSFYEELAGLEQAAYDRSKEISTQLTEVVSQTVAYATSMTHEWRKISMEATQRTAQMFRNNT